ncbi:hypothetical protein [Vibrio cortegadensis]|uniref:hypothetical protein n=1 Tax=Vibrio cortegadensis TaxID=1328770 RepID=UPI003FD630B2
MKLVNAFDTGGANLGESHTKSMGDGLFDIRAKAQKGSGRGCFVIWMVISEERQGLIESIKVDHF